MISAFGVEHEFSKARRGPGVVHGRVDPNTSMVHRGGDNYYNPSSEQVAAAKARRTKQAEQKAGKLDRRVGGGKKVPWSVHRKAMGKMPETMLPVLALGGGAAYALNRRTEVKKSKKKDQAVDTALGATAGTAAGAGAVTFGGQAAKITLKNRRAKRGESPREKQIWAQHAAKHGGRKVKGKTNIWRSYQNYPKELPDWKAQRALAFKNRPAVSLGLAGLGTAAGAKYGYDRNRAKNKP